MCAGLTAPRVLPLGVSFPPAHPLPDHIVYITHYLLDRFLRGQLGNLKTHRLLSLVACGHKSGKLWARSATPSVSTRRLSDSFSHSQSDMAPTLETFVHSDEKTWHDQKKLTKTNTKTKTMTKTKTRTFWEHLLRAILETCDLWDICSEWWEDVTWPKKNRQWQIQRQRQWQWYIHLENTLREQK